MVSDITFVLNEGFGSIASAKVALKPLWQLPSLCAFHKYQQNKFGVRHCYACGVRHKKVQEKKPRIVGLYRIAKGINKKIKKQA